MSKSMLNNYTQTHLSLLLLVNLVFSGQAFSKTTEFILGGANVSISDVVQLEGNAATSIFSFDVTLDAARTVSIDYATADGTASAGEDYTIQSGTLDFLFNGPVTQNVLIEVVGDTVVEMNETFFVNLSNPVGPLAIVDGQGLGTINNDDVANISIDTIAQAEGDAGTSTFDFTVSVDQTVDATVQVDTADGTAIAGVDYVSESQLVTFISGGSLTQTFSVTVNGDTIIEPDETILVNLSMGIGADVITNQVIATINNDDFAAISIDDVTQIEGDAGTTTFDFTVSIDQSVNASVQIDSNDGTATAGSDYVGFSQLVNFTSGGSLTQTISVTVNGDALVESNETFTLDLSNVTGAVISDAQGLGRINNDDFANMSINDVSQVEGDAGTTTFDFTISIDQAVNASVQVDTANGSATAGSDYTAVSQIVNFSSGGSLTQLVSVVVNGDTSLENNETFTLNLDFPEGAVIVDGQGQGTITNDDFATISIDDVSQIEGNAGTTTFDFTVSIDQSVDASVQVDTANGSATAGSDYVVQSQVVNFTSGGALSQTVSVTVNGDTDVEGNETFFVNLTNATGATISDAQGLGTISNDDSATISIDDVSQIEGNAGTTTFDFTVSIDQSVDASVQVDTANGSATAGSDYVVQSQVVNFTSGGALSQTVSVTVNGDTTVEPNEIFFVNLSSATGATISDVQGLGTISNDDSVQVIEPIKIPTNNIYGILLLMLFISVLSIKRYKELD